MFGAGAHHSSQESPPTAIQHKSAPLRPSHPDSANPHLRVSALVDTPMPDVANRSTNSDTSALRPQQQHQYQPRVQTQSGELTPHAPNSSQHSQRPPPSPRFKGHSTQQTPIPNQPQHTNPRTLTSSTPSSAQPSPAQSARSSATPTSRSPSRIKVRSLSHIQSFATDGSSPFARRDGRDANEAAPQYEISEMPVTDIIEMVAGLLTKITTTNDRQHEHLHRQIPPPDGTTGLSQQTTSVLAFHGKNVPSISILSYLSRIHKYCPTTYEVFLSLLVYFDRMTERVNSGPMQSLRQANQHSIERRGSEGSSHSSVSSTTLAQTTPTITSTVQAATPPPSGSLGAHAEMGTPRKQERPPSPPMPTEASFDDPYNLSHFFVVDSFNIHRLVIAGVTCASKFFSDIFYTNSRYAKVGGLPLPELNHLELQFLLLNDFRLSVPLEEMEAYGTMLVEFYAREVLAQHQQA